MLDFLAFSSDVVPWESVLLALLLAYLLSQWIAGLYTWTYRGLSYSRGYVQSLVLAGIIACMLMLAIGNNLVRGLGIVGTLALIRFRTNLRDPWDMIFIFAVFGVGIAAGTQSFEVAVAGTAVFSLAAFVLYKSGFGSRQQFDGLLRLSLPSSPEVQQRLQQILQSRCRSFVLVTLRETAQGAEHDHAYQVRLWAPAEQAVLVQEVSELPGARGDPARPGSDGRAMRTPEPTPEAGAGPHVASGGRRLNGRRRLAETLRGRWPWLVWGLALVGALALYGQIGRPGRAIGEAELRTFALAPPDRARVISIDVQLGDRVTAGQVLAVLDSAALDGELGETEALMEQLRKELERERTERTREYLESTGKISGGAEDSARRLAAARAEQARLQGELGATEREIARQQGLVGQQLTSAALLAELQQKQAALHEEKAGMDAAVALLAQQAAASHRRLEQWRSATAPDGRGEPRDAAGAPDAALAPAPLAHYLAPIEAAIRVEERKRQRLLAEREAYRLRAPVDATVGFIHLRTGEVSGPELPVLTVVAPASDRVIAYVGEDDADGIRVGMRAHLRPRDGSGAERRGTVVFVAPAYSPLPYRYQILRNRPAWCRQALVRLDPLPAGEPLPVPGEAFDLAFFAGDGLLPGRDDLAHGPAVTEPATRELAP